MAQIYILFRLSIIVYGSNLHQICILFGWNYLAKCINFHMTCHPNNDHNPNFSFKIFLSHDCVGQNGAGPINFHVIGLELITFDCDREWCC